jgi:TolB-like protein
VVPFNGIILNKALDFSVDGFCGYLSQKLSLFQDITVKSYYSVNTYLENGGNIEQLGKDLDVTYYLTGSIRIEENQVSISVQLIHARSNYFIWSHDFKESLKDHSLSDVSNRIVDQIVVSLAGYSGIVHNKMFSNQSSVTALTNSQAIAVFWYYHYLTRQNEFVFKDALRHLENTVIQDSGSSLCWSILSMLYVDGIFFNYDSGVDEPLEKAIEYVNKALDINPSCQHGTITLAWINIILKNKAAAMEAIEKAYAINPNASFFTAASSLGMALLGEYGRSKEFLDIALPMNPMPYWWLNLPMIFIKLRNKDYSRMLFHARKVGTPAGIQEHIFEMIALFYLNDIDSLKSVLKIYLRNHPHGIDHAIKSWPMAIFDKDLIEQVTYALTEINLLKASLE